jgi:tetratricopeptide (TPR) repeat protein
MRRFFCTSIAALALAGCSSQPSAPASNESPKAADAMITMTSKSPDAVAALRKGEMLLGNLRNSEATAAFDEALKLDPDFTLAHAYRGSAKPGAEGAKELDDAAAAAAKLPEAERRYIDGLAATRHGDSAAAQAAFARVIELAPADWRGHYNQGLVALGDQQYADAVAAMKKATDRDPKAAASAQNMIGYAALRQDDTEQAIAAFQEYTRALPDEPNPQDSLGEALLAAGRFKDADAAYQKALQLSPQFFPAHQGIAYTRFYQADWAGGRDALQKANDVATRPSDKVTLQQEMAAAAVAQGHIPEALKLLDASEKVQGAQPTDVAIVPVNRAYTMLTIGRYKDAIAPANVALKLADSGALPPGLKNTIRRVALQNRVTAEAQLHDAAAAKATSASLDEAASARPMDPLAQSTMHYGRAMLALAQNDATAAKTEFAQCSREDEFCKWQGVMAAEKRGDKATATTMRDAILKTYKRDPLHLVVRSRLTPARTTSTQ